MSSDPEGNYLPGYEGYGRLIGRLAESAHQSCVLVTSREKPREIEPLEGARSPVRSLRLVGMDEQAVQDLLADKGLNGTTVAWQRLVAGYTGNPLEALDALRRRSLLGRGQQASFSLQSVVMEGSLENLSPLGDS